MEMRGMERYEGGMEVRGSGGVSQRDEAMGRAAPASASVTASVTFPIAKLMRSEKWGRAPEGGERNGERGRRWGGLGLVGRKGGLKERRWRKRRE